MKTRTGVRGVSTLRDLMEEKGLQMNPDRNVSEIGRKPRKDYGVLEAK